MSCRVGSRGVPTGEGALYGVRVAMCGVPFSERVAAKTYWPEYPPYQSMLHRCDPNAANGRGRYWAGKGITVCDEWKSSFLAFAHDIGPRPNLLHSLDRYPNKEGHYVPGNVRWATRDQQAKNRCYEPTTRYLGEPMTVAEAARRIGVPAHALRYRLSSRDVDCEEVMDSLKDLGVTTAAPLPLDDYRAARASQRRTTDDAITASVRLILNTPGEPIAALDRLYRDLFGVPCRDAEALRRLHTALLVAHAEGR